MMKGFFAMQMISVMLSAQLVYGMSDDETPIGEALLIEEQIEQEEQNCKDKSSQLFFEKLDPHWFHEVHEITEEGKCIKLKDGSLWAVDWWSQSTANDWAEGDLLSLKVTPSNFYHWTYWTYEFFNGTKNETVWATLKKCPSPDSSYLIDVEAIENYGSSILLSNGVVLYSGEIERFRYWKEGDIVLMLSVKNTDNPSYALFNIRLCMCSFGDLSVASNLSLENLEEQNCKENKSSQLFFEKLDPHWFHEVHEITEKGKFIKLKDGSLWAVDWWSRSTANDWAKGDLLSLKVTLSNFYNWTYEIFNGTKNKTVWATLKKSPSPDPSYLIDVEAVENHGSSILLSNGVTLYSDEIERFRFWQKGDMVLMLSVKDADNPPYALLNISTYRLGGAMSAKMLNSVVWNLSLDKG